MGFLVQGSGYRLCWVGLKPKRHAVRGLEAHTVPWNRDSGWWIWVATCLELGLCVPVRAGLYYTPRP